MGTKQHAPHSWKERAFADRFGTEDASFGPGVRPGVPSRLLAARRRAAERGG